MYPGLPSGHPVISLYLDRKTGHPAIKSGRTYERTLFQPPQKRTPGRNFGIHREPVIGGNFGEDVHRRISR